jgi:hypothetical protein
MIEPSPVGDAQLYSEKSDESLFTAFSRSGVIFTEFPRFTSEPKRDIQIEKRANGEPKLTPASLCDKLKHTKGMQRVLELVVDVHLR